MSIKEITEVCRLCVKDENLVWVFDKRFDTTENMRNVIFITTGVEIDIKDTVSKKICRKCLQIVIKIYQFRGSSLKNDAYLKNKYEELTKSACPSASVKGKRPHSHTDIKTMQPHLFHKSIRDIMDKNPNLVLPKTCLYTNMSPYVAMPMNYVETYFKRKNIDMQKHISYALQAIRSDMKTTDSKVKKEDKPPSKPTEYESKNEKQFTNIVSVDHNNKIKITTVEKVDDSKKHDIESRKEKLSSRDSTPEFHYYPKKFRKRRISSSSDKEEDPKPSTSSYSDSTLAPKKLKCDLDEPVQMSYVARTLEICNICNSVQYSLKELKRHKLKHLRCQFCKERFKTMERKEEHIREDCVVRKTMNSLPKINLMKVELDKAVRQKYPNAFVGFAPILENSTNTSSTDNVSERASDSLRATAHVKAPATIATTEYVQASATITTTENMKATISTTGHVTEQNPNSNGNDVIEILSDDDDDPKTVKNMETLNGTSNPSIESNSTTVLSANENVLSQPLQSGSSKGACDRQLPFHNDDLPTLSSSIVKPDIRIKNNIILETIDPRASDIVVLKDLLKSYKKMKLTKDSASQPELPSNTSIVRNLNDFTTTLKDLNHQLRIYRIPVEIKHGAYKVTYDYSPKQKTTKKKADWNHLTPMELIINANNTSNSINDKTNTMNPPNVTLNNTLSRYLTCPLPKTISITKPTSLNTTSVVSTNTLRNYSKPQGVPVSAPPSYSSIHLTNTNRSINTISNQPPTVSYHPNNTVLAQFVYQPNTQSTVLVNQPNNYVAYNPNNSVYNSSSSVMIPNSVPQVLVASSPVFPTNPVFNANSVESLSVLPSSSGVSSLTNTSLSHSNSSTPNLISSSSSTFEPPQPPPNSLNNCSSGSIYTVEKVLGINTVSRNTLTTGMPSTSTTMPLIRVKDLGSLK